MKQSGDELHATLKLAKVKRDRDDGEYVCEIRNDAGCLQGKTLIEFRKCRIGP